MVRGPSIEEIGTLRDALQGDVYRTPLMRCAALSVPIVKFHCWAQSGFRATVVSAKVRTASAGIAVAAIPTLESNQLS